MLIRTLMIYAVNRCLLTSAVAIVEVIVFIATPGSLWFIAIDFVIGKLYANSLLASLNSRNALRAQSSQSGAFISADASTGIGSNLSNLGVRSTIPISDDASQHSLTSAQSAAGAYRGSTSTNKSRWFDTVH
ncbi:hypothetical protein MPER_09172 [Moniliophthora perniciosa FA553]|nr:hypothetical protein MPER_09172 [Moniliophthora perniciosa FA553]